MPTSDSWFDKLDDKTRVILLFVVLAVLVMVAVVMSLYNDDVIIVAGGAQRRARVTTKRQDRLKDLSAFPPSKAEQRVRAELERLVGAKFPTVHPSWLDGLELDGYNKGLKLAFEFQGPQHTRFDKKYDKDYATYYERILNDEKKRRRCLQNGVFLINVDYIVPQHLLSLYLKSRLHDYCKFMKGCGEGALHAYNDPPDNYMREIHHELYRNPDWEASLEWVRQKTGIRDF